MFLNSQEHMPGNARIHRNNQKRRTEKPLDKLTGKRLLILGGAGQTLKVVNTAHEMGIYVIVTDRSVNFKVRELADECLPYSVKDVEGLSKWLDSNKVDGILNFNIDAAQTTQLALCTKYGFPCYGAKEQYDIFTNKNNFKQFCQRNGLDIIPEYTEEDVINDRAEYPILIKPADSSGSRGNTVCYSKEEALEAIRFALQESYSSSVIIEKFMAGYHDFAVTYYTVDGVPHLTRVGDRYVGRIEDGLNRQCICGVYPSKYTQFYLDRYDEKMKTMIRNAGVINGPTFFQGFIDGDKIRWYDPAIRFSGGEYEQYYKTLIGLDLMRATIVYALTGKNDIAAEKIDGTCWLNGYHAVQLLIDVGPGTITTLTGIEEIRALPEVAVVTLKHKAGDVIARTGDINQRIAEIVITMQGDLQSVHDVVRRVQSLLRVEDENGNDMLVSQFDAARLLD